MTHPILVTGAAGRVGGVGGVGGLVVEALQRRGLPVRAMVRREDERAEALRATGAEVVVGDLTCPADVGRALAGCRRLYFGMSVFSAPRGAFTLGRGQGMKLTRGINSKGEKRVASRGIRRGGAR